ncbi:MAG: DUF3667 domain-containing protein [Thalassotalea sp.]|nr:DUF3667 domain-containing protein [Thalassotalea sp.]
MSVKSITNKDNHSLPQDEIKVCENCHANVQGMYCSQCGQSVESTLRYFWSVILHLLDDIFSFDSRSSRTLFPLLFRPAFLTNEYIAGRRVHYVPPLRLYLFISIIFFISLKFFAVEENIGGINVGNSETSAIKLTQHIASLVAQKEKASIDELSIIEENITKFTQYREDLTKQKSIAIKGLTDKLVLLELKGLNESESITEDEQKKIKSLIESISKLKSGEKTDLSPEKITFGNNEDGSLTLDFLSKENNKKLNDFSLLLTKKAEKAFNEDPEPLINEAIEKLPQLMFILLPLFAALLKIMFIFSRRLYLEHLTVALHSHSFIFLSILLVEIIGFAKQYTTSYQLINDIAEFLEVAIVIWIPIYLFIMQKRVYKQGMLLTTIKYSFIGLSYILMISITGTIAFIWGLAST